MPPTDENPQEKATLLIAEQIGTMMEFWGFKRILGRIWTVLFLADEPLTNAEIGTRLKLSASAVSVSLAELKRWGVVHEAVDARTGRAQRWRAETDIWSMVTNVMRQRELPLIKRFDETLQEALDMLDDEKPTESVKHMRHALKSLQALTSLGKSLLTSLLESAKVNAEPLRKFRP